MNNQYNILIDVVGAVIVGIILIAERMQVKDDKSVINKLLHWLMLCCFAVYIIDIIGLLIDGKTFAGARMLLWIFDSGYWILQIVYCWLWLMFAVNWTHESAKLKKIYNVIFAMPMLLEIALILSTSFTGWIFSIDKHNEYLRGSYYIINMMPYVIYICAAFAIALISYRMSDDRDEKRRDFALCVYMFLPICGVFFDIFVYGISWVWPMVALSLLMVYLNVQQQIVSNEKLEAERTRSQLTESRMAVMLSQIQPHFLYNALSSIAELCDEDPQTAKKATVDFSNFLRGNLASLTADKPISFSAELEHTKNYLSLELLRFPDKLKVEYNIETALFRLPTLSLQPLVENAVRYGVTKRVKGGTVRISTHEENDVYKIIVEDDGVGFDPMKPHEDGRTHIGISNVRGRLERMCAATLEIHSIPGVGTKAEIILPKRGKPC